jgi:tetratricopeptide (TPR) repeat protein
MRKYGVFFNILVLCLVFCFTVSIPKGAFAQIKSGIELYEAGDYVNAEAKLRVELKAEPRNTTARYYLGLSLLYQGNFEEALDELKTAKSEQEGDGPYSRPAVPSDYQLNIALAQAYIGLGQLDKAWPRLESAKTENPDSSDVFLYRGVYFYVQKDYAEAIKSLEKSISLDAKKAYAYYYMGMAYSNTDEPDKMVDAFKIFLQLAPDAPEAPDVKKRVDAAC